MLRIYLIYNFEVINHKFRMYRVVANLINSKEPKPNSTNKNEQCIEPKLTTPQNNKPDYVVIEMPERNTTKTEKGSCGVKCCCFRCGLCC